MTNDAHGGPHQKPTFKLGDRVKPIIPRPLAFALDHGVVVFHRGRHNPEKPRVRWASGWGTSQDASELRLLTEEERKNLPHPATIADDVTSHLESPNP